MDKTQQITNFVINHKTEIKSIGALTLAFVAGVIAKKTFDSWRGQTLVKLFKGSDMPTTITNIETLLIKSDIPYELMYDPECKEYFITVG